MKKLVVALVVIAMIAVMMPTVFATTESADFMLAANTPYEWTAEYTGTATLSGEPAVNIMVNNGSLGLSTTPSFEVTAGTTYTVQHFGDTPAWITWSIVVADGGEAGGDSGLADNQVAIESYSYGDFTAPETGTVKLTLDVDAQLDVVIGYSLYTSINSGETIEVEAGTTYSVYPVGVTVDTVLTYEYVEGGSEGGNEGGETPEPEKQLVDLTGTVVGACSGNAATAESYADFTWWSDGRPDWKPLGNFVDGDLTTYFSFGASAGERSDLYLDLSNTETGYTAIDEFTIYHSSQGDVPSVMVVLVLEDGTEWTKTYETNWVLFGGNTSITEVLDETKNAVGMYIWQNGSDSAHFGDIEIYQYVATEEDTSTTVPSGGALALGDNSVTLTYANMPMMAPYWTYTATETGTLTVTVSSINGNTMLDMPFGMGMYTLLVGETNGAYTNTATVNMNAGETVNVAVLDTMDMTEVPAVINLAFTAGEPEEEKDPADYFVTDPETGYYIIDSLQSPVDIFVVNDDICYTYTAESAGTVTVTHTGEDMTASNCWIKVNDGEWDYFAAPATVAEGDTVIINIWNGYEGTVTLTAGETEPTDPTDPEATEPEATEPNGTPGNPYVINALPYTISFYGGMDEYYVYTAAEDGTIIVTALEGGLLSLPNGETWEFDEDGNYAIPVTAGQELVLNPWTMRPEIEGSMVVSYLSDEPEATEPEATEPEATEPEATEPEATEPEATEPEATEPSEGDVDFSATDAAIGTDGIVIPYTPETDGILTVVISGTPGYEIKVVVAATDATVGLPVQSGREQTLTYELNAGVDYNICITGYDAAGWDYADSTISYDITFEAAELEPNVIDIDKSDVVLELGENSVELLENTIVSLYEFVPAEPGVYTITVGDGVTMGVYGFSAWNLIDEDENGVIEYTATAAEQTFLVGLTAETASVTVTIEKTGDYTPSAQTQYEDYESVDTVVSDFVAPTDLEPIDITEEQNVVLGDDGYYHLGTADGPIVYVNLNNEQFTLATLYDAGAPITMRGTYVDEEGEEHPYDFMSMITGQYYSYSQENDYHPLNTDLMIFLKAYGASQGWYNPNTTWFDSIASGDFNEESAWLASCYVSAADLDDDTTGDDTTGDDTTGDDTTGDDTTGDDTTGDDTTGDDTTGDDTTGDDTTGDDTTGDDTTGDDTTGDDTTGDDTTGDDTTGDDTTGDEGDSDLPADTGDVMLSVLSAMMAVSAVGGAVVIKKKEF